MNIVSLVSCCVGHSQASQKGVFLRPYWRLGLVHSLRSVIFIYLFILFVLLASFVVYPFYLLFLCCSCTFAIAFAFGFASRMTLLRECLCGLLGETKQKRDEMQRTSKIKKRNKAKNVAQYNTQKHRPPVCSGRDLLSTVESLICCLFLVSVSLTAPSMRTRTSFSCSLPSCCRRCRTSAPFDSSALRCERRIAIRGR